jgi:hypothetical protein
MKKKDLIVLLNDYNDDDDIVVEVHDTVLYEDLYTFYIDGVSGLLDENSEEYNEIRICPKPFNQK